MADEPNGGCVCLIAYSSKNNKGCWFILDSRAVAMEIEIR